MPDRPQSFAIVIAVLAAVILVGESTQAQRRQRVETVTARAMLAEFQANEIRASQKYDGRAVRVSGTVESVGSSLFGGGYFTFEVDAILAGVQAMIDDEDALARLDRGQRVAVICRDVSGGDALGIVLNDCDTPR